MKTKQYISPVMISRSLHMSHILMASNDRVSSNVGLSGGSESGDAANAL